MSITEVEQQQLQPDVSHPADPQRDDGRSGHHQVRQALDSVIRGDAGVRVRRHVDRVDPRRDRHDRALGDDHELSEAAVHRQPRELVLLAHHVAAAPARHAQAARVRRADQHRVAHAHGRHQVADGGHVPGVLVPEHDRQRQPGRLHLALDRVEVGGAHACARHLDQHLVRAPELRVRPLDQLERAVVLP